MANAQPKWLFMLYLSGDNNLSSEMIWSLKDIQDQGLPDGVEMTILLRRPVAILPPRYVYDLSGQEREWDLRASREMEINPVVIRLPLRSSRMEGQPSSKAIRVGRRLE